MQHKKILTILATATLLASGAAYANNMDKNMDKKDMEYCEVTNKAGKNVIKAGKADCNSMMRMNCKMGDNKAGDTHAAILVPKGQCDKIKMNDFSGMSKMEAEAIKSKLDMKELKASK